MPVPSSPLPPSLEHSPARGRWFTRRAVLAHVALIVWVPGCVVACWWQVGVARSGDSLGWIYSVMWPCFAVFGTVFWWHFVHDDPDTVGRRGLRRLQQAVVAHPPHDDGEHVTPPTGDDPDERRAALARAEAEDPELAAYNAYLASLARDDRHHSRRRP